MGQRNVFKNEKRNLIYLYFGRNFSICLSYKQVNLAAIFCQFDTKSAIIQNSPVCGAYVEDTWTIRGAYVEDQIGKNGNL